VIERGDEVSGVLFPGTRTPMTQAQLRRTLAPVVARWIKAACLWDRTAAMGDHRFVIFSIAVAPKVQVYVQLWSEPGEPVLWEVSSGKSDPPADKWLSGERSRRIEAFGFEIGGEAENFLKEVEIATPVHANQVARAVVDIFYACFDYRGLQALDGFMVYESRAVPDFTYDSFTPEDLLKILANCGFAAEVVDDNERAPVIHAVRRGTETRVVCTHRVEDERLFQTALLTSEVEVSPELADEVRDAAAPIVRQEDLPVMTLGTTLMFDGGVTVAWVMQRLRDWDAMTWEARKTSRKRPGEGRRRTNDKVH
jgi:hypothetical protein